jgi:hypothetical protein
MCRKNDVAKAIIALRQSIYECYLALLDALYYCVLVSRVVGSIQDDNVVPYREYARILHRDHGVPFLESFLRQGPKVMFV